MAAVELDVLVGDPAARRVGGLGALGRRQRRRSAAHLVERPAQVDGGGAGRVQLLPGLVEGGVGWRPARIGKATP